MVYLVDDNQSEQQQKKYNAEFLFDDTFKQELQLIYSVEDDQMKNMGKKLMAADAILLHNTFADYDWGEYQKGSRKVRDFIEDISEDCEIPLVLFSNGFDETKFDDNEAPMVIRSINKDIFYGYLFEFLNHYKENKVVELKILAFGKDYKIQDTIRFIENMINQLKIEKLTTKISEIKIDLSDFERFYESLGHGHWKDFWIESRNDTISTFIIKLNKIKKSLIKYGRYI